MAQGTILLIGLFVALSIVIPTFKKTLVENGIDLPFPTQQILFHDQTEAVHGRARFRYGWKKQVKSSSLLPSASCLLPCFLGEIDGNCSRQREGWPSGKGKVPKPRNIGDSLTLLAQESSSRDENGKVDA